MPLVQVGDLDQWSVLCARGEVVAGPGTGN